jgi:TldD protein
MMRKLFSSAALLALTFIAASSMHAQSTSIPNDAVLKAMQAELARSQAKLQLPGQLKPYFIQYRVEDLDTYESRADFGAVSQESTNHQRAVRVEVRVGDYTRDSSTGRGDGTVLLTTPDENIDALRFSLWSATDTAYKSAVQQYTNKLAKLKGFEVPPNYDDFAREKPEVSIAPLAKLDLDRAAWKKRIEHTSGLFLHDADLGAFADQVQYSVSTVSAQVLNRYIVNTEGSVVRDSRPIYRFTVGVGTQAADGMHLDRSYGDTSTTAATLAAPDVADKKVAGILIALRDLSKAPMVSEQYIGPVLFSGDASTDIVTDLFKPNIEADRPDLGTMARTQGEYTSSYKQRVLPSFLNLVDDPTLKTWKGKPLIGSYDVDDEAVPSQKIDIATRGLLQNYDIDREPVRDFPVSNGHGRASIAAPERSLAGVLVLSSSAPLTKEQMQQKLMSEAKDAGLDTVYVAETLGPQLAPRMLYKVDVATGKRELVRGAVFDELDQRSLRTELAAAGDDDFIDNFMDNEHGEIPVTIIAPSLLFQEIAVKRATEEQQKLPYYPPPPVTK